MSRRRNYNSSSQNNHFLITFLSLVVLFETILLLFLLPKSPKVILPKKTKLETITQRPKAIEQKNMVTKESITPPIITKIVPKKAKGKIAIVIDDWGYNANNLDILSQIKLPLTLAVLPFLDYSHRVAQFAHENNYEVIIHMPMEPDDKTGIVLEPKTLMVNMAPEKINKILEEAFLDIPYAKGINNHMGSLATRNKDFITAVFGKLKENNLYFLDSYVVPNSICYFLAKKMGVKFARREIFLDNKPSYTYIRGQLMALVKEVDKTGYAVGIGHDRRSTLNVLKELMPQLAEEGYQFVFISEIVK
jgi:polysaccharide deacetylase 2 family uncharacterized protein YibQ